jgi:hypothetical protein
MPGPPRQGKGVVLAFALIPYGLTDNGVAFGQLTGVVRWLVLPV